MTFVDPALTVPDLAGRDISDPIYACEGSAMRDQVLEDALREDRCETSRGTQTLSDEALALVNGERADAYGHPRDNLARIGHAWSSIFGLDKAIPSWKVALALCSLKLVRAAHRADEDSIRDAYGYLHLVEMLKPDATLGWADGGLVGGKRG